ncbi:MAG: capsular biosynthesis protein [Cytophagaceae bacterium]|nr:capsular biosynthesis protein [Cytophagaceae bacterium]
MVLTFLHKKTKGDERSNTTASLAVDVNAHVLPGLDNGAETEDESLALMMALQARGFRKLIATPHVMETYYPNSTERILAKLERMRVLARQHGLSITLDAAAQYYLDESLLSQLRQRIPLLTFVPRQGSIRYLLFETSFVVAPVHLLGTVEDMIRQGYTPVLAHPERCLYLQKDRDLLRELHRRNVLFQVDINSLTGYNSRNAQRLAEWLIEQNLVYFLGSDCHRRPQLDVLDVARDLPYYHHAIKLGLLNNTLL